MKETFTPRRFSAKSKIKLAQICEILAKYDQKLTDRQLYYQLISQYSLPNSWREYLNLCNLVRDARLSGDIDWDAIEDRTRTPDMPTHFDNVDDGLHALIASYRLDRWAEQKNYVEVWIEKDALSSVFAPVTSQYHILLMANRGYSSITAIHDASVRFKHARENGKECVLLYFGDHDPSGEDMVRDIHDRLNDTFHCPVEITKIALTKKQVQQYNLPPNPAKRSDPRASKYMDEHGDGSWELDALPPDVLQTLLTNAITKYLDLNAFDRQLQKEGEDKQTLSRLAIGKEVGQS